MKTSLALFLLVLANTSCAQDAPRITIANGDHDAMESDGSARLSPGSDVMQELLNWGIQHSDPERLKELMQKYQEGNLTIKDVYGQDVIDALFVNEGSVMKDTIVQIADFKNISITDEDLENALRRLQEMVEQVDNAGNLHGMGGLQPLLDLGCSDDVVASSPGEVRRGESIRSLALWTLGVAVQNNPPVQVELNDIGGLIALLGRLKFCANSQVYGSIAERAGNEYCGKLIFAISGLVKNNQTIQSLADSKELFDWLLVHGITQSGISRKSMALLDIVLSQNPSLGILNRLSSRQDAIATSLLAHMEGDADAAEKALRLVNRLLSLRPMLFAANFRSDLTKAVASVIRNCEQVHGSGDELCEGLSGIAKHADLALAARELSDEEL